ncbi:ras-interacting protein RIP3-like [Macrobrachium nipponense]|uniref:ras-interacting protein RIP3-like n=1 Tax=Macrobrachium nipponense TaxID=159736 RepID=UPI0030C800D8
MDQAFFSSPSQSDEQNQSLLSQLTLASLQESLQEPMALSPAKDVVVVSPFTFSFEGLSPLTFNPQITSTSSVSSDVGSCGGGGVAAPVSSHQVQEQKQQQETAQEQQQPQQQQQQQQQSGRVSKPRRRSHRRQRRRRRVTSTAS